MTMFRLFVHLSARTVCILCSVIIFSIHISELTVDKLMDRRQYLAVRLDWFVVHTKTNLHQCPPSRTNKTRYGLCGPWIESWWRRDLSHQSRSTPELTQPLIQWVPGHFGG